MSSYALMLITMECQKKVNNTTCGKCTWNIFLVEFLVSKDISRITRIATNLVWMTEFEYDANAISTLQSLRINCNGSLVINKISNNNLTVSMAIYLYCKLIKSWYSVHTFSKQLDSYIYIKDQMKEITNLTAISKVRSRAISISKYIESITVCTGNCTTVVPNKEISNCKICLSDINKIVKFSSEGLVDVIDTIFYTIKDVSIYNLTIDLNTTYVTCSGNIIMDRNFIKCKSTVADMKGIYIYYLSAWCSANIIKESEVRKVRDSIDRIRAKKYMHEMYDISCDLLSIL